MKTTTRLASVALALSAVLGTAACGDDTDTATEPAITVDGAWARTSPSMVTMGAAYMNITSAVDDELVGVAVDESIASDAQIHEMVMATENTMSMGADTTMSLGADTTVSMGSGEMVMQEVESIAVPADGGVELKPGGYHVMLIDLVKPLETGQTFDVTLTFAKAGDVVVSVTVADEAP